MNRIIINNTYNAKLYKDWCWFTTHTYRYSHKEQTSENCLLFFCMSLSTFFSFSSDSFIYCCYCCMLHLLFSFAILFNDFVCFCATYYNYSAHCTYKYLHAHSQPPALHQYTIRMYQANGKFSLKTKQCLYNPNICSFCYFRRFYFAVAAFNLPQTSKKKE